MNRRIAVATLMVAGLASSSSADVPALRSDVGYLAAPEREGRLTGSVQELESANYLADALREVGARPLPALGQFLHEFEFTAGTNDTGSSVELAAASGEASAAERWTGETHVRALSFSEEGSVRAPVVFAGYGLVVPESRELSYDSFAGLDVEDKIVLVLRYSPEEAADEVRSELARYSGLRYKALAARERGAKAVLVVTGPRSPNAGKTVGMSFDAALSGSGILGASIGGELAEALFARAGKSLDDAQAALDTANPHAMGFDLQGVELALDVRIEREKRVGHNVVGYLPAGDGPPAADTPGLDDTARAVLYGAHFDHLGRGRHGNSLARQDEIGEVHRGADDNASGVAALLEVARAAAKRERRAPLVFAFWSGEELGLLGSSDFVADAPLPMERIAGYVNLDMVGRLGDDGLNVQGVGSSPDWAGLIERANVPVGLDLKLQADPYLPTDSSVFYQAGVPTVSLFTGSHEDYHRPSDVPEKVDFAGLERVSRFAGLLGRRLARREEPLAFERVERTREEGGSRDTIRAYTGTIPDYGSDVEGLRLSGVMAGGPAEKAGLAEGDVIVEFGGRTITNIYDYTYALDAVKIDKPLAVVYLRGEQRLSTTIIPTARP